MFYLIKDTRTLDDCFLFFNNSACAHQGSTSLCPAKTGSACFLFIYSLIFEFIKIVQT